VNAKEEEWFHSTSVYCVSANSLNWPGIKKTELRSSTRRNRRLGVQIMRGILFWLVGIPIPIIIPFYLFDVV
jgi:hypothetical protein